MADGTEVTIDASSASGATSSGSDGVVSNDTGLDSGADLESGQIDNPDAPDFNYDRWVEEKGMRPKTEKAPDLEKMKAEGDKKAKESEGDKEAKNSQASNTDEAKESDSKQNNDTNKIEIKLKVNGEERTVNDLQEITRLAQLGAASNEKFQEAAAIKKDVQSLFDTLRTNPGKVFRDPALGKLFKEAAEQYLYEEYSMESLPQDQREGIQAKRRLAEIEAEQQEQIQAQQAEYEAQQREQYRQQFSNQIQETLKIGKLPENEWTVKRMAFYLQQAISQGVKPTSEQLANRVRNDLLEEHKTLISQTDDIESLIGIVGKDNIDRIRKHNIQKIQQSNDSKPKVFDRGSDNNRANARGQKTYRSAAEMMDDLGR